MSFLKRLGLSLQKEFLGSAQATYDLQVANAAENLSKDWRRFNGGSTGSPTAADLVEFLDMNYGVVLDLPTPAGSTQALTETQVSILLEEMAKVLLDQGLITFTD